MALVDRRTAMIGGAAAGLVAGLAATVPLAGFNSAAHANDLKPVLTNPNLSYRAQAGIYSRDNRALSIYASHSPQHTDLARDIALKIEAYLDGAHGIKSKSFFRRDDTGAPSAFVFFVGGLEVELDGTEYALDNPQIKKFLDEAIKTYLALHGPVRTSAYNNDK